MTASMSVGPQRTVVYRSFGPTSNQAYLAVLSDTLERIGRELDVTVELSGVAGAQFATKQFRVFHPRDIHRLLVDLYQRDKQGVGCIVIGNIQDPGLYEARQACQAPVVGLLESTVSTLRPFGTAVGLLASSERVVPLLHERLRVYRATESVSGIEVCGRALTGWADTFVDARARDDAVSEVLVAARRAADRGADLIVPASGIVAAALAACWGSAAAWQPDDTLPAIINPIYLAVAHGVMAMNLHAAGTLVSRSGTYARPDVTDLEGLLGG